MHTHVVNLLLTFPFPPPLSTLLQSASRHFDALTMKANRLDLTEVGQLGVPKDDTRKLLEGKFGTGLLKPDDLIRYCHTAACYWHSPAQHPFGLTSHSAPLPLLHSPGCCRGKQAAPARRCPAWAWQTLPTRRLQHCCGAPPTRLPRQLAGSQRATARSPPRTSALGERRQARQQCACCHLAAWRARCLAAPQLTLWPSCEGARWKRRGP